MNKKLWLDQVDVFVLLFPFLDQGLLAQEIGASPELATENGVRPRFHAAGFADALPAAEIDKTRYSPYPEQKYPNRVFFGDTHLHTSFSEEIYHVTSIPL